MGQTYWKGKSKDTKTSPKRHTPPKRATGKGKSGKPGAMAAKKPKVAKKPATKPRMSMPMIHYLISFYLLAYREYAIDYPGYYTKSKEQPITSARYLACLLHSVLLLA